MPRRQDQTAVSTSFPKLTSTQCICCVQGPPKGANLFEVNDGQRNFLVELPKKFRKSLWVKRGSYVVVECADIPETSKIQGEIIEIFQPQDIKQWKKSGDWPSALDLQLRSPVEDPSAKLDEEEGDTSLTSAMEEDQGESTGEDDELWQNPNRR